ncbi:hypothetical protein DTO271G3_2672 [Paecilomyces variotii]|nr:hypothetical protein DTO271G3_2672 [Paecilomyces variotii]
MSLPEECNGDTQLRLLMPTSACHHSSSEETGYAHASETIDQPYETDMLALNMPRRAISPFSLLRSWIWEGTGIVAAAVFIIAMVAILHKYNQQKQPDWTYMSLNSLISWMSTLSKACLLFSVSQSIGQSKWLWFATQSRRLNDLDIFDSASRGALGSVSLLLLTRGRSLAILGSLATILSLGFDPFVQNLVHYVPRTIDDPSQISLVAGTARYNTVGPLMGADDYYVDPVMKANVYESLFNLDPSQPWAIPQYTCPTGNCTWDPMTTFDIRSMCTNITSHLMANCTYSTEYNATLCTQSLKSGTSLQYFPSGGAANLMVVNAVNTNTETVSNSPFPVIQYILIKGTNEDPLTGGLVFSEFVNNTQFAATECVLQPIVKSFRASVTLGVYKETKSAEWTAINITNKEITEDLKFALTPNWNESYGMKQDQTFGMGYEAWSSINTFITELFQGKVEAASDTLGFNPTSEGRVYATTDALEAIFYNRFNESSCKDNDQLSCAISQVTAAMSKTVRDSAFTKNISYQPYGPITANTTVGHTKVVVSYVSVHWEWIILPAMVWAMGALFYISSVWSTHRAQVQTWMNSTLPLLSPYLTGSKEVEGSGPGIPTVGGQESSSVRQYYTLACFDMSLKNYTQRAKYTQAKLEPSSSSQSSKNA